MSNPAPDGYRSITPFLKLPNAGRLVESLKRAFDGIERGRLLKPDGTLFHAEVLIGDSLVMVHDAPGEWKSKPSTLYLYVGDVDATYKQALKAGGVFNLCADRHVFWRPCGLRHGCVGKRLVDRNARGDFIDFGCRGARAGDLPA